MIELNIHFDHPAYSDRQILDSVAELLEGNSSLALAPMNGGGPYLDRIPFASTDLLDLILFVDPAHVHHGGMTPMVAEIWNGQRARAERHALELVGFVDEARGAALHEAYSLYSAIFPAFRRRVPDIAALAHLDDPCRLFILQVEQIKLLDERRFGRSRVVTADVKAFARPQTIIF